MAPDRLETGAQCCFKKFDCRLFIFKFSYFVFYLSFSLSVISKSLAQLCCKCCNHSVSVVLNVWFTTNRMYVKNNTLKYVSQTSRNRIRTTWNLYCCLLPHCETLHTCRLGFPITTKWCFDQGVKVMLGATFTKRMCDKCASLQKGGDVVATFQLMLRWKCNSPQMGCAQRATQKYMRREQAIIEWSRRVIPIIACCHSVKLCALAVWAFWSQHKKYTFLSFACLIHENGQRWTCTCVTDKWGCLHFRAVPQEHWLINEDWPRRARNYNEENQTRPLHSTRSVYHKRIVFTHGFINITLRDARLLSHAS